MKKFFTTAFMLIAAMTASAQDTNVKELIFDFNQNPWNHPTTGVASKGWNPDYDDETGFIWEPTTFDWPLEAGSDKKVSIIVSPPEDIDPEDDVRPPLMYYGPDYDQANNGSIWATKLWANPGATVRFIAPKGYQFDKMIFWFYRNSYFTLQNQEEIQEGDFLVKHFIWTPETEKSYDASGVKMKCWQGDATDILFDYYDTKAVYEKIHMRLIPDSSTDITDVKTDDADDGKVVTLDGRPADINHLSKGIYIAKGRKFIAW